MRGVHLDFRIWSVSKVSLLEVLELSSVVKRGFQFFISFVMKKTINSPRIRKNFQKKI